MGVTTSARRPPRWSKKTDQLVRHVATGCRPRFQSELGRWLEDCSRFAGYITANQDKVRKKLGSCGDEECRLDVRSELLIAYLILADPRFELSFEAYGARRLGPDLTVTYRTNQRFNLEVTRLRATTGDPGDARLASVITGKLRQLPADLPNALVITTRGLDVTEESLVAAVRLLKMHTDSKDDAFLRAEDSETRATSTLTTSISAASSSWTRRRHPLAPCSFPIVRRGSLCQEKSSRR
jgi:hypothetical protein